MRGVCHIAVCKEMQDMDMGYAILHCVCSTVPYCSVSAAVCLEMLQVHFGCV